MHRCRARFFLPPKPPAGAPGLTVFPRTPYNKNRPREIRIPVFVIDGPSGRRLSCEVPDRRARNDILGVITYSSMSFRTPGRGACTELVEVRNPLYDTVQGVSLARSSCYMAQRWNSRGCGLAPPATCRGRPTCRPIVAFILVGARHAVPLQKTLLKRKSLHYAGCLTGPEISSDQGFE